MLGSTSLIAENRPSDIYVLNQYKTFYLEPLMYEDGSQDLWGVRKTIGNLLLICNFPLLYPDGTTVQLNYHENGLPLNTHKYIKLIPDSLRTDFTDNALFCIIRHSDNYRGNYDWVELRFVNNQGDIVYSAKGFIGFKAASIRNNFQVATKHALKPFRGFVYQYTPVNGLADSGLAVSDVARFTQTTNGQLTVYESYQKGRRDAVPSLPVTAGYFAAGLGSGALLGLIGTAILYYSTQGNNPSLKPVNCNPEAYSLGYAEMSKPYNRKAALIGGLLGTVIAVGITVNFKNIN